MVNNYTIANTVEYAICKLFNLELFDLNLRKINEKLFNKIEPILENYIEQNDFFKVKNIEEYNNENLILLLENNQTMCIKLLKKKEGKLAPKDYISNITDWDNYWGVFNKYNGIIDKNFERFEFIKKNINNYLNKALSNIFSSDYLLLFYNCDKSFTLPKIKLINKNSKNVLNYFDNKLFIYNREFYTENWNEKKKRKTQFSTIIKLISNEDTIDMNIGEFEFNTIYNNEINFRFYKKFIESIESIESI